MENFQFITHHDEKYTYLDSVRIALEGGCRWVQLRMKNATEEELRRNASAAKELCLEAGAVFIIDDYVDLALEVGADGVHLGKNDMPIPEARRILGNGFIIGGTANTIEDIRGHWRNGADYIGCGPFRFTATKENLSPVLGLEGYRDIVGKMKDEGIDLPMVAVGGITCDDIPGIMETGAGGIALSGTILRADDPVKETRKIINILNQWKN